MLGDLSLSLRALLKAPSNGMPELAVADVSFERPGEAFSPSQPTLNLYLYDVRENTELRNSDTPFRRTGTAAAFHERAPIRVAATYLVTAWSGMTGEQGVLLEQRLLSQALIVFARHPRLPASALKGRLADQDPEVPVIGGQAEGLRNPSEFWTSLNNRLRPSISVTATVSMPLAEMITAPLVSQSQIALAADGATAEMRFEIGGRVLAADRQGIAEAELSLLGAGRSARSDAHGQWRFSGLPEGAQTVRVVHDGRSRDFPITVPAASADAYELSFD